jgi:polyhydroxyalkanoate synthesis regulator phasin
MGDQAAENLKVQRDQLMDTAQKAGAAPSTSAAFQPLVDHVQQLVSDGRLSIEDAKKIVSTYSERMGTVPNPTVQQMSQWKSDISNSLPASVYDVTKNTPMAKNMGKIAAGGNRDEVARAMNAALPGSGEELNDANEQLGNLLTVQNVADKQAARELNKKLIQPQDIGHAAIAGAAAGKPEVGMGTLLGRIAAGTINSPGFRTTTGYGLRKLGTGTVTAPVLDAATFNALKQMANQQPTAGVGK